MFLIRHAHSPQQNGLLNNEQGGGKCVYEEREGGEERGGGGGGVNGILATSSPMNIQAGKLKP